MWFSSGVISVRRSSVGRPTSVLNLLQANLLHVDSPHHTLKCTSMTWLHVRWDIYRKTGTKASPNNPLRGNYSTCPSAFKRGAVHRTAHITLSDSMDPSYIIGVFNIASVFLCPLHQQKWYASVKFNCVSANWSLLHG
jgi:hypothetical protein